MARSIRPWTAANDRETEGTYVHEGRPQDPFDDALFATDQPNGGTAENCVGLRHVSGREDNDVFGDAACSSNLRALCERDPPGQGQ